MKKKVPLLVILGSTGSGKSSFGIRLGKVLNKISSKNTSNKPLSSCILNCDVFQVFKGLEISTNKPTKKDKQEIRHFLFDYIDVLEYDYNVCDYQRDALKKITELNEQSKRSKEDNFLMLIGGTNYYIESIVYENFIFQQYQNKVNDMNDIKSNNINRSFTNESLYENLKKIDAKSAKKLHRNDDRKIKKYLNYYAQTGEKYSDMIGKKKKKMALRFDCVFIHLTHERSHLFDKINKRSIVMTNEGLIKEIKKFHEKFVPAFQMKMKEKKEKRKMTSLGICQSIGYKEIVPFIKKEKKIEEVIKNLQTITRQYARKQISFFRNRWCSNEHIIGKKILYEINVTNNSKDEAIQIGLNIIKKHFSSHFKCIEEDLNIKEIDVEKYLVKEVYCKKEENEWKKYFCEFCKKELNGEVEWKSHLKSKKHKYCKRKKKKLLQ